MSNNIGYSSIYPTTGAGAAGPIGPTGSTGPVQTVRGPTGATGLNSNYITQVVVDQNTGEVKLVLSDGTSTSAGTLKGPSGIYAGLTADSIGGGYPILKGVCGGITLDFYNFRTNGLLGLTYEEDGTLRFTISANTTAGGISASTENNRIVYVKERTYIMSTDLIPEVSTSANRVGGSNYGYVNFGGETAGRNVVAQITDSIASVGPIHRGEKIISLDDFYDVGIDGITLDVSRATVYQLTTPIGIKAFTYESIPDGQIMSVTLVIEGDDVWNFPTDVVFDEASGPVFYPGTNILHMWRTSSDSVWRANFTARAFGVTEVNSPGVRGSCCYFDVDNTKYCEDYVTQSYCDEREGTFEGLVPCNKNSCTVGDTTKPDGVCCSEGRCLSDIDPNFCQTVGGYFISGLTCGGEYGVWPDDSATNISTETTKSGLCFNQCKPSSICCKNGECLGQLTYEHCRYLEGTSVTADDCSTASCCNLIKAPGACCIQNQNETYTCTAVETPAECSDLGGVYMGKNTTCDNIKCDCQPNICYRCDSGTNGCNCTSIQIDQSKTCLEVGLYPDNSSCTQNCIRSTCHKCENTICTTSQVCGTCAENGLLDGECVPDVTCKTKTCYENCFNCSCQEIPDQPADQECPTESFDLCNCDPVDCQKSAVCFWCFPEIQDNKAISDGNGGLTGHTDPQWLANVKHNMEAPYRAAFLVDPALAELLEDVTLNGVPIGQEGILDNSTITTKSGTYQLKLDLVNGNPYFTEDWTGKPSPVDQRSLFIYPRELNYNWFAVTGKYECRFVGAYAYSSTNTENNKKECLNRFGYADFQNCKVCDETKPIKIPRTKFDNEPNDATFNKIEPYNDIPAPFPPLWGRRTDQYRQGNAACSNYNSWTDETFNLRLLSQSQIRDIVSQTFSGNLKTWLKPILDDETPFSTDPSNNGFYKNAAIALGNATYGLIDQMPPRAGVNASQKYIHGYINDDINAECHSPRIEFDPYRIGLRFSSISGARYFGFPLGRCSLGCFDPIEPEDSFKWGPAPTDDYPVLGPIEKIVNPPRNQDELAIYPRGGETLANIGEKYLIKPNEFDYDYASGDISTDLFKFGIFGRNLRYNIDSFRTATVFYHDTGVFQLMGGSTFVQTMGYSDNIVIPLAADYWITYLEACGNSCLNCGTCPFCHRDYGCRELPPAVCPVICTTAPDSGVLAIEKTGRLVSSTQSSGSPFAPITQSTQLQQKTVKLAEGICVDILCSSDCSSYESC